MLVSRGSEVKTGSVEEEEEEEELVSIRPALLQRLQRVLSLTIKAKSPSS